MLTSLTSPLRDPLWLPLLKKRAEFDSDTLSGRVALVMQASHSGILSRGETVGLLFDLSVHDGIEATLDSLIEPWKSALLERLTSWALANSEQPPISIFGGIRLHEIETDPVRAAEMHREELAERDARAHHFLTVLLPRIRTWWGARTKPEN